MSLGKDKITQSGFYSVRNKESKRVTIVELTRLSPDYELEVYFISNDMDSPLSYILSNWEFLQKLELE